MLLIFVAGGVFCAWKFASGRHSGEHGQSVSENHIRLVRSEIPMMPSPANMSYSEMFPDMNDIQLEAAKRNGLHDPYKLKHPEQSDELVRVETCEAYAVDALRHSKPYLVPQAEKLLMYIGHRFNEIQTEYGITRKVRPIVTSLLRSRGDVKRLRRVNRNATENSCHLYGTTFDISYTHFMDEDAKVVSGKSKYKDLLAKALYELRFENLCYVRYERRQPCFHITVRSVDYEGDLACETVEYDESGQPAAVKPATPATTTKPEKTVKPEPPEKLKKQELSAKPAPPAKTKKQASTAVEKEKPADRNTSNVRGRTKEFEHRGNYVFD